MDICSSRSPGSFERTNEIKVQVAAARGLDEGATVMVLELAGMEAVCLPRRNRHRCILESPICVKAGLRTSI